MKDIKKYGSQYVEGIKHDRKTQVISGAGALGILGGALLGFKTVMVLGAGALAAGVYLGVKAGYTEATSEVSAEVKQ